MTNEMNDPKAPMPTQKKDDANTQKSSSSNAPRKEGAMTDTRNKNAPSEHAPNRERTDAPRTEKAGTQPSAPRTDKSGSQDSSRSDKGGMADTGTRSDKGAKPDTASRSDKGGKPDMAPRSDKSGSTDSSPRSEKASPSDKPAPRFDDRPAQQRGGSGEAKSPSGPIPSPKVPGYGDNEPSDPRHLDVDAGTGGRTSSDDRSQRS